MWDGTDINAVDAGQLRTGIAVNFQDFARFHLRARDNVGLGRVDAIDDLDGIREAARQADADTFLSSLPNGYETVLGPEFEGGSDLSADSGNASRWAVHSFARRRSSSWTSPRLPSIPAPNTTCSSASGHYSRQVRCC
jgi:ATP-binding cassette subfamily B protein